jgi:hypothetical protein
VVMAHRLVSRRVERRVHRCLHREGPRAAASHAPGGGGSPQAPSPVRARSSGARNLDPPWVCPGREWGWSTHVEMAGPPVGRVRPRARVDGSRVGDGAGAFLVTSAPAPELSARATPRGPDRAITPVQLDERRGSRETMSRAMYPTRIERSMISPARPCRARRPTRARPSPDPTGEERTQQPDQEIPGPRRPQPRRPSRGATDTLSHRSRPSSLRGRRADGAASRRAPVILGHGRQGTLGLLWRRAPRRFRERKTQRAMPQQS